jgi:rhodanese-related sulfurtransferase
MNMQLSLKKKVKVESLASYLSLLTKHLNISLTFFFIMKKLLPIVLLTLIVIISLSILLTFMPSQPSKPTKANYRNISSDELYKMMSNKDFVLINVHIPYEGEIEGTDIFIPYNEIKENLNKLPNDKNTKIVVYCMSGRMSEIAADELVKIGYTNVLNLERGMIGWKESGYKLIKRR